MGALMLVAVRITRPMVELACRAWACSGVKLRLKYKRASSPRNSTVFSREADRLATSTGPTFWLPRKALKTRPHSRPARVRETTHTTKAKKGLAATRMPPRKSPIKHWAKLVRPKRHPRMAPARGPITTAPMATGIISRLRDRGPMRRYPRGVKDSSSTRAARMAISARNTIFFRSMEHISFTQPGGACRRFLILLYSQENQLLWFWIPYYTTLSRLAQYKWKSFSPGGDNREKCFSQVFLVRGPGPGYNHRRES